MTASPVSESWDRWLFRRVRRWAVLLLITYLEMIAVLWFLERRLVFRPYSAEDAWLTPEDERSQDVSFTTADGATIHPRWIPRKSPRHGRGFSSTKRETGGKPSRNRGGGLRGP